MAPRLGFALSLLAACGVHAILLFTLRAAPAEDVYIPTVELELTEVSGPSAPMARPAVIVTRPVGTQAPSVVDVPRQPEAQPPAPAAQPGPEPAAAAPGGQADVPAGDQAASMPSSVPPASAAGAVPGTPGGAGAQSSSSGPPGPALGTPAVSSPVFIPPTTRTEILPVYPRSARRSGLEGVVKVTAVVDESGKVTSAEVLTSSGHGSLDQAAVEAVRRTSFDPALQDGRPIVCRIVIPVRFKLAAKPVPY